MKIVSELKDISLLENKDIYGWIINVLGLSAYYDRVYSLEEIKQIVKVIKSANQKVYINVRKIIHEQDVDRIIEIIKELELIGVDYYFYGDMAFYEIASMLGIKHKLIYQVTTYMTNIYDIEVMLKENSSVVVSTELSLEEVKDIVNNIGHPLYLHSFGYYPIFHSRRELISNYLKYRGREVDLISNYDIVEELRDSHYPIEQNENGMVVYLDGAYCLSEELKYLKEDSICILLSKYIDLEVYKEVLGIYTKTKDYEGLEKLNIVLSKGLLYEQSKLLKKEGGMACE